jgi:hypothetical protein
MFFTLHYKVNSGKGSFAGDTKIFRLGKIKSRVERGIRTVCMIGAALAGLLFTLLIIACCWMLRVLWPPRYFAETPSVVIF